ncbi:autotransporter outer membrane beta-barrel domain-containing protein [Sneathiella marina]|uniref:Autotransporter outer membrane beta-barrel domain-containing protein n=1 Tax=Sneathiella marina TaxID=2950108 RepID=A0ABY4W7R5_9PROT|nr:autotransporter outer membrane beta-barrel domain-containing protein [Sneathiella marina]USG61967.1 autotransporter outer membrane beta-barrel domain-containing protein [Sneathiella marina]
MSKNAFSRRVNGGDCHCHSYRYRLDQPVKGRSDYFCGLSTGFGRIAVVGLLVVLLSAGNSVSIARADCVINGTVETCTGDLSDGVSETNTGIETLNVNSLTDTIAPDGGTSGISFRKEGADGEHPSLFPTPSAGTAGSDGGAVSIGYTGEVFSISTIGNDAEGIVGWSSGGTGGGGLDGIDVGFAGHHGGSAGAVKIVSVGEIKTAGDQSDGILAVTLGGSGGHGGAASSNTDAVGGVGGDGGTPEEVYVQSDSKITTTGDGSQGILIQSVGGTGGVGGEVRLASAGVSGEAGQSGEGGLVILINTGDITTGGTGANGVLIQSLGGLGGDSGDVGLAIFAAAPSGSTGAAGGQIDVTNHGTITTTGPKSDGILAQSIGGGGGHGGSTIAVVSLGGDGEGGGDGGYVSVVNHGVISTEGVNSLGILAQSVGGGGGDGGSAAGLAAIGGQGDDAANGGAVHVINTNRVSTVADGSLGILVQSIGGGGGHGGDSDALISIGGQSGKGGDGDVVNFENTGDVSTEGDHADGIRVQSVGSGGGKGGGALSVDPGVGVSVSVGGNGGSAGNGSNVFVNKDNTASSDGVLLTTKGDHSVGLAATSIGGGGGSGGWALAASGGAYAVSVAVGGDAKGGGGYGGAVEAKFNGGIFTEGDHSAGIAAQSTGGGGGSGGSAVSIAASAAGSVDVSVGGHGAIGGFGDTVDVTSWTAITTIGDHSPGIIASSIGGGGGNGGLTVGAGISSAATVGVAIGGTGSGGGYGSAVTVNSVGNISTSGDFSHGLLAQSVGGGGGNGGFAIDAAASTALNATIAIGGASAAGSNSDAVIATSTGNISTAGDHAYGFLAQSIGGGGGNGGHAISASGALAVDASVGLGGTGTGGGDASSVTATNTGDITTHGDFGYGLLAQSLGGGGGNGGYAIGGSAALGQSASVTLGGSGAGGGDGSTVFATNIGGGNVKTTGDHAHALFAQSLGGGGGNGGYSIAGTFSTAVSVPIAIGGSGEGGGDGGAVTLHNDGTVYTSGVQSNALFAQSLGGGGGDGGFSVAGGVSLSFEGTAINAAVSVGGQGGAGGTSDTVDVINDGYLLTLGQNSAGIMAQSVGGGGGNGGLSVAGSISLGDDASLSAGVTLAGSGGTGNSAADVTVVNNHSIRTEGDNAAAIFAQSVGGGGGNGGASIGAGIDASGGSGGNASVAIGGSGGNGNDGDQVDVTSTGNLTTKGDNAAAIFAQSVGGGGGNGSFTIAGDIGNVPTVEVAVSGSGSDGGKGSMVKVDSDGIITTSGSNSFGVQAQSLGGAGGNGGFSIAGDLNTATNVNVSVSGKGGGGGTAGAVTLEQDGSVVTGGAGAYGLFAQSVGGGGGNGGFSIAGSLTLATGSAVGAGVSVAGDGGTSSSASTVDLTNRGNISTSGDNAIGALAQSIGGSGGNGGFSVAGGLDIGGSADVHVSLSGTGGIGNNADVVTLVSIGDVTTFGSNSAALLGQSIGGGGGNGGFSVGADASDALAVDVSVAGGGSSGGLGAKVSVESSGILTTYGAHSYGILAQSLGGAGGNGGFSVAGSLSTSSNVNVSVSGGGGGGGTAGLVEVTQKEGYIITTGSGAHGIFAQSLGGGGGNGGFSVEGALTLSPESSFTAGVSVAGGGGDSSTSSDVTVVNTGGIQTEGDNASGIFAQSLGGGGGSGGFSVAGNLILSAGSDAAVNVSVAGAGGTGNAGSDVKVNSTGDVITTGTNSTAILAQSIGGGGGNAGFSVSGNIAASSDDGVAAGASVSGEGGEGNDGAEITLTSLGNVSTSGNNSSGILAQSVGGGGGNGGFSGAFDGSKQAAVGVSIGGAGELGGNGDTVTVDSTGIITTEGSLSYGVLAQSVGGSGGNGGFSLSGAFSTKASVGVSIGGGAGGGGTASAVTLVQKGSVWTKGSGSHAVFAQSVGGGGGTGGFSGAAAITFKGRADLGVSIGGKGGTGGTAGAVSLTSRDGLVIHTEGDGAYGLLAQSIGGGGGDGGFSFAAELGFVNSDSSTTNIGVSIGGNGETGGAASTVEIINSTAVVTLGNDAYGILAQSVGGGGGSGGLSISGSVNLSTDPSNNLNVAIGGEGKSGNIAAKVTVENDGNVTTIGDRSRGILAQSVGGSGGVGGLAFSGTLAGGGSDATAKTIEVAVGGSGGSGANAGDVELKNSGDIATSGDLAEGILAQSIGGGGGAGGLAGTGVLSYEGGGTNLHVSVAVGGTGGVGGLGENVMVTNNGRITGTGLGSTAIYAQSIGGGGGNGGSSFTGVIDLTKPGGGGGDSDDASNDRNLTVNVAIGGEAGSGASAGTVSVVNTGVLTTYKGSTKGIFAQSVGGSGGSGGASDAFSMEIGSCSNPAIPGCGSPDFTAKSLTLDVSIGGNGGDGNNGDAVSVTNKNIIQTYGDGSEAIYAQSIGAGGGEGGNGSLGQNLIDGVPGEIIGDIDTVLNPPFAFWQEIEITVGGAGGATGSGGTVTVDNDNTLITTGDRSSAIFAQSVGGGGGQGGNTDGNFLGVGIGGSSGAAGDGDKVAIVNDGSIRTDGIASIGIFAQSVGGGGGLSGSVKQDFFGTGADVGIGFGLSKGGGHGGHGGDINVENTATIMTAGSGAHGVFAQSVGGGGGLAGSSGSDIGVNFAGSNGDDGDGGDVTVTHTGYIYATGDGAAGIFAQSASGGADGNTGNGDDDYALEAAGIGGLVTVTAEGSVMASGDNSIGIFAQSVGLNGDGQVVVVVDEDVVITGGTDPDGNGVGEDPAGIRILDGSGNSITINGTVTTLDGVLGTAIDVRETQVNPATALEDLSPDSGSIFLAVEHTGTTLTNNGTVIGSIFLADGDNLFTNTETFIAGETIDLGGSDNQFVNDGILSPGGEDTIITTTLNGAYLQTENGQILADVDFADNDAGVNSSDMIQITGDAVVNGTIVINSLSGAFVEPDETGEVAIITSSGEFGTPSITVQDTEVVDYELRTDAEGNVFLAWDVDFSSAPGNFNANQSAIGNYLVAAIAAGEPEALTPLFNEILDAPNATVLADYYDQLSPEPYLQTEQAAVLSAQQFGRELFECPESAVAVSDTGCGWLDVSGRKSTQSAEFDQAGYDETVLEMQFGIGGSLGEQMDILFGLSYEKSYLDTEGRASTVGNRFQTGVGMSFTNDSGTMLSLAAVGGFASNDIERHQTLTGTTVTARGNQKLYYGGGQARVLQSFQFDHISVAPEIGGWVGYFRHNKLTETGAGPTNLEINAGSNTYVALRPAVTVGTEFLRDDGSFFRPYLGGGASFALTEGGLSRTDLTASLQGDSNLAPAFTASRSLENPYYDVQLGLDWVSPAGVAFRVGGVAQFANNYKSYGGTLRLVAPF